MHYRPIPHTTSPILSSVLYDVYELTNDGEEKKYTTAPNGIIGIALFLEGDSLLKAKDEWQKGPKVSVYGLINNPDVLRVSPRFREIAIGFKPYFFQLLVAHPMSEIVQCRNLDAKEIFDAAAVDRLYEKLRVAKEDASVLRAIEEFVLAHIRDAKQDKRVQHLMHLIYSAGENRVDSLSEELNVSSKTVRNLCLSGLGRSTKEMIQLIRINKVLSSTQPHLTVNLQDIAYANRYFDQAHFIHDFKSTMGMTPKKYFESKDLRFDFYNFKRWNGDIFEQTSH